MKGHRWFAAVYDAISKDDERRVLGPLRRWVVGDARGRTLEIGAGTGFSFPHYATGTEVVATEPDPYMLRRAVPRAAEARRRGVRLHLVQCSAEALPFAPGNFDSAVAAVVL
jgi:SAM-dependent methyltransferase